MAVEVPSRAELRKSKVVELRQRLSKLFQPQGGVKEELITRLITFYKQKRAEEEEQVEDVGEENLVEETMMVSIGVKKDDIEPEATPSSEVTPPIQVSSELPTESATTPPAETTPPEGEEYRYTEPQAAPETTPPEEIAPPTELQQDLPPPVESQEPETTPSGKEMTTPLTQPQMEAIITKTQDYGTTPTHGLSTQTHPETTPSDFNETKPNRPVLETQATPMEEPQANSDEPLATPTSNLEPKTTPTSVVGVMDFETEENDLPCQVPSVPPSLMGLHLPKMAGSETVSAISSDYYSASDGGISKEDRESGDKEVIQEDSSTKGYHSVFGTPYTYTNEEKTMTIEEKGGKRKRKKKRRRRRHDQLPGKVSSQDTTTKEPAVEIEYIQEDILKPSDPNYRQFHKIFESFRISDPDAPSTEPVAMTVSELVAQAKEKSKQMMQQKPESSSDEEEDEKEDDQKISKKKLRKLNRLTVAQLKQLVERPDVVEMHDVTATDPKLLIHLKSSRNTVPVPRHWCFKRKYLQGKRGIEKPPFDLPDFIKATGVMEMRQALEDKEDAKSLKQKTRERVRPKMGKLTIDYQKLHDAFFKWQTKPKMTIHGDMYYEGKEFETRLRQKKPGDLSDELRRSLGMPTGMGKQKFPPPWLVAMQRYGPPPSYPNLKIPGLNAAIPENCSFGYFVGGWGKPPVDEIGRPLYGDVFGLEQQESGQAVQEEVEVDKSFWGELESEEEEDEEEEESEKEDSPKPEDIAAGLVTPMEGMVTPSGLTSIPAGLETPDMIQLRKKKIEEAMEQGGETPTLYTVIPEKMTSVGGAMMGSSHVYDLGTAASATGAAAAAAGGGAPVKKSNAIEVALDPSELDLDTATITARYEEQVREKRNSIQKEDLSDMVAEHAAKQKKRKRTGTDSSAGGKAAKKLKEFKF